MKFLYTTVTMLCLIGAGLAAEPAPNSPERTQDCCHTVKGGKGHRWCADGTAGTPFCGKGPCNAFGCACKGGCRKK
ncbi:uncharacterized protein BDW47DRAFT_102375 [Aspergillus candidus]|uniref:Uncharacterized protein n=1 Tax=Aspergillus candidus TaxID=41067 RepID=A0A2I2FGK7_ASPCN|nr:hypothetical protein BDW47DRAFT_102375 [Aspergillus candidus]PLB39768.1 hypothetical protein BDW47DRAFT_102375 [Aspergillus candidus]